jgi:SAM-dependent methyltransferase
MSTAVKPRTADTNGLLWGHRARDWSERMEPLFRPVYAAAFDRVEPLAGAEYLDVGCGAGLALQVAADRGARVHGLDAADPLLEIARQRTPAADIRHGDIEVLPFTEGRFDLVTGFNAFQYAGNPVLALEEARRVCKKGGHVLVATWGQPEGMEAASLVAAMRPLLPPPPPGAPGPFALSDEATLRAFAASAGLVAGECFDVEAPWHFDSLATALLALKSSGVGARAIAHSDEASVDKAHATALAPFAQSDGSYRVKATFRCLMSRP